MTAKEKIQAGRTFLGIEFGSTRIKASLIDDDAKPLAEGSFEWENRFENGYWTYSEEDIINGLRGCYLSLAKNAEENYGVKLTSFAAMGISGMMHGYMPFDVNGELLVPFRTWRNTTTAQAAEELSGLFGFNIPQRWSIAHLYQAILNDEPHIGRICSINTLAGFIHRRLTGNFVVGAGEASGIFPMDGCDYDSEKTEKFDKLMAQKGVDIRLREILPKPLKAGERAGTLTEEGALLIDPTETLKAGIPLCPPEGDAGTGMAATNSVRPSTGNVSAGTSIFSMLVLEKPLKGYYPQIDIVSTPDGSPAAMVHCNNCCSEIDAWVRLFGEFSELCGNKLDKSALYELLYKNTLSAGDCGGAVAYNFISGEPAANAENGRPMYFRAVGESFTLAGFFKAQLYSTMASLKMGMDILFKKENVSAELFSAHGGLFKVRGVAQQYLADALNTPTAVMKTSGEGGAWGMALLAAFMVLGRDRPLADFLDSLAETERFILTPDSSGVKSFEKFMARYKAGLNAEKAAAEAEL